MSETNYMESKLFYLGEGKWAGKDKVIAQGWKRVEQRSSWRYALRRRYHRLRTGADLPTAQQTAARTEWLESL